MMRDDEAAAAAKRTIKDTQWKPGQSGNPAGRAVTSRNKLSEKFLKDMLTDWEEHGAAAIAKFRDERPGDYVKAVAQIVPKQFSVKVTEMEDLTDEQLGIQLAAVLAELAEAGALAGEGSETAEGAEPAGPLPTLQ